MPFEHSLKNAYIGRVLDKSIDLRGKTLAQIEAEGWNLLNWRGSYTLDTNGLTVLRSSSDTECSCALYFDLPEDLTSNGKITVSVEGYCTVYSSTNAGGVLSSGLFQTLGNGYYNNQLGACYSTGTSSVAGKTSMVFNDVIIGSEGPRGIAGNISYTATFDLSSKACSFELSSPSSFTTSGTLTASQVSSILNYKKASIILEEFRENYMIRLYTAHITLEY